MEWRLARNESRTIERLADRHSFTEPERSAVMEFNRNQFMMIGVVLLLFGLQFRTFEACTLSAKTTQFLAARFQDSASAAATNTLFASDSPAVRKVVRPPNWLGWSLMSVGSVLVLHSLAMKKPGG